jgi:Domain of unknown function (DUF4328)
VTDQPFPPPPALPPPPSPLAAPSGYATAWLNPPAATAGLRTATTILFWCTAGATVLLALAAWNRLAVWNGFEDGSQDLLAVEDADGLVGVAVTLQLALTVASAIVVSIWSQRSMRNASARREGFPSPGLACGGWYIPVGNLFVPFVQFRKALRARPQSTSAVNWWQGLFIAGMVSTGVFRAGNPERADVFDDVSSQLRLQVVGALLAAVFLPPATIAASRAMRNLDRV